MPEERSNPRRRPRRRSKFQRFLRRYFPSILLLFLSAFCICAVIFTVTTISSLLQNRPSNPGLSTNPSASSSDASQYEIRQLISVADKLASFFDYPGSISLLQRFPNFETYPSLPVNISEYT